MNARLISILVLAVVSGARGAVAMVCLILAGMKNFFCTLFLCAFFTLIAIEVHAYFQTGASLAALYFVLVVASLAMLYEWVHLILGAISGISRTISEVWKLMTTKSAKRVIANVSVTLAVIIITISVIIIIATILPVFLG